MERGKYIEKIPAGALSAVMPESVAVVINISGNDAVYRSLSELYNHNGYRIYFVDITPSHLEEILEICAAHRYRSIVLCGKVLPTSLFTDIEISSASLISPGSDGFERELLDYMLSDQSSVKEFAHIGYQTYKYDPDKLKRLKSLYFEEMRLGVVRSDMRNTEPLLRGKKYSFIDMCSIRHSDLSSSESKNPNGLYAEEICQIARYIGMSLNLCTCFVYGIDDVGEMTAQILWHLFEGLYSSIYEDPADPSSEDRFNRKIVRLGDEGQELVFVSSKVTDRWWMEIPLSDGEETFYVPCSYNDYAIAKVGEIPLRWLFFYQKVNRDVAE